MWEADRSIHHKTDRWALNSFSRFAFLSVVSWQSWDPSLALIKTQMRHQQEGTQTETSSYDEAPRCAIIIQTPLELRSPSFCPALVCDTFLRACIKL